MFIFKKHLSRRTVLKGAGVTLALPLLDAMVPAATALAQTAATPRLRGGFFYIPHGAVQYDTKFGPEGDRWTPLPRTSPSAGAGTIPFSPRAQREGFFGIGVGGCCGGAPTSVRISNHASGLQEGRGSS